MRMFENELVQFETHNEKAIEKMQMSLVRFGEAGFEVVSVTPAWHDPKRLLVFMKREVEADETVKGV